MKVLNEKNFNNETTKDGVNLVIFSASWCNGCTMMKMILEQLRDVYKIYGVDVEESQNIARDYSIRSLPTTLVFKDGVLMQRINGPKPKDDLLELIEGL